MVREKKREGEGRGGERRREEKGNQILGRQSCSRHR
jgi:hypothetical protein